MNHKRGPSEPTPLVRSETPTQFSVPAEGGERTNMLKMHVSIPEMWDQATAVRTTALDPMTNLQLFARRKRGNPRRAAKP